MTKLQFHKTDIYIADTMKLLTLNFPAGYAARLAGFGPTVFPRIENQIHSLQHVLRLILSSRMLMENEKFKIEGCLLSQRIQ